MELETCPTESNLLQAPVFVWLAAMDFYDNIRKFYPHSLQSVFDSRKHKGRNLQLYQPDTNDTEISSSLDGHENLLFCHIPQFLEYSDLPPNDLNQSSLGVVEPSSCDSAYASSVAAMMAMHHFNTGNGTIVPELRNIHERTLAYQRNKS